MKKYKARFHAYSATSWDSWNDDIIFEAETIEEAKAMAIAFAKDSGPNFNTGDMSPEYHFDSICEMEER